MEHSAVVRQTFAAATEPQHLSSVPISSSLTETNPTRPNARHVRPGTPMLTSASTQHTAAIQPTQVEKRKRYPTVDEETQESMATQTSTTGLQEEDIIAKRRLRSSIPVADIRRQQIKAKHAETVKNIDSFWGQQTDLITWRQQPTRVRKGDFESLQATGQPPQWFINGKLNLLDSMFTLERANQVALKMPATNGIDAPTQLTYAELQTRVHKTANMLREQGIQAGDVVGVYLPMGIDAVVAMLACHAIGAIHSVIFSAFSDHALAQRMDDSRMKAILTADGYMRAGKYTDLKGKVDKAIDESEHHSVAKVFVMDNNDRARTPMTAARDIYWRDAETQAADQCDTYTWDSNDPFFYLYTSGSTGKPKGIEHAVGGYGVLTQQTLAQNFGLEPGESFWCTADVGWITGHSYIAYGPLMAGAEVVIADPANVHSEYPGGFWKFVADTQINHVYTAPTFAKVLAKSGHTAAEHDVSCVKTLGLVGEPSGEHTVEWMQEQLPKAAVIDTWWQTETGGNMISAHSADIQTGFVSPAGFADMPGYAIDVAIIDENTGVQVAPGQKGLLVIRQPWPGMARTIHNDPERFVRTYFPKNPTGEAVYLTGDYAIQDPETGAIKVLGRSDDVLNVAGHRIGTEELESAMAKHPKVQKCAVVGAPDALTGEAIYVCIQPKPGEVISEADIAAIKKLVRDEIGPTATPKYIQIVDEHGLPETRSGKIMRRFLRKMVCGETDISKMGDASTLRNPECLHSILPGVIAMRAKHQIPSNNE